MAGAILGYVARCTMEYRVDVFLFFTRFVLYLQLRNGCFGNNRFGTKSKVYEVF